MAELDFEVTDEVDITDKVCPLTFVKAKVAIEELEDGEVARPKVAVSKRVVSFFMFIGYSCCPHERRRTGTECSAKYERGRT